MKIKKLCAVALLLLLSFYAKAQNWQAYKGVWLKGYDNATQAPVPPSGYSALTYFADSLGTYVYDWDSLAWLRVPGTGGGGGGGGFTTADNGLTASSATNVQLGGPLIKNTTIPLGGFSYTVGQFPDNVNFSVNDGSNSITANLSAGSSGALFSMTASNAILQHSGASGTATLTLNQSTETATISSSSGSQVNFNVATSASPVITTQSAENFTISKPLGLMSSSGSLQIGGPDGLVTSLENTESGNTAIFDVRGTNETFSMRSGSGGSTLTVNVASSAQVNISTASDQLQLGTSNAKLLFDNSDDTALFSADVVLQNVPNELDTAVWFLARDFNTGAIVQRKSAGGGSVTADNGLNIDPVGNVRIGTHSLPGFVESDGAVFSTDSLADAFSTFTFDGDSVQISNHFFDGELNFRSYLRLFGITAALHANANALTVQPSTDNTVLITRGGNNQFEFSDNEMVMGSAGIPGASRTIRAAGAGATILNLSSSGSAEIGLYGGFHRFISNTGREITADPDIPILANVKDLTDRTFALSGGTGTASANNGDAISLSGGNAYNLAGDGNGGNVLIQSGQANGSGTDGNITIDALTGFLIISNIPTSDPCASAPPGTVWDNSGVLSRCP